MFEPPQPSAHLSFYVIKMYIKGFPLCETWSAQDSFEWTPRVKVVVCSLQLLPRRSRHHRGLRRDRPGVVQQREAVAPGDWQIRVRERQQASCRKQMWSDYQKSGRLHHRKGEFCKKISVIGEKESKTLMMEENVEEEGRSSWNMNWPLWLRLG